MRVLMNFDGKSEFLAFYIPRQVNSFEKISVLPSAYKPLLEQHNRHARMRTKVPGDTSPTSSVDLAFSGRIFIYYEDMLSLEQLAFLEKQFTAKGLSVQFRGNDYLTLHWNERRQMLHTCL
jgi:hypothetical protein